MDGSTVALSRKIVRYPAVAAAIDAGLLSCRVGKQVGLAVDKVRRHLDRRDGLIDGRPALETLRAVIVDGVRQLVGEAWCGVPDDDPRLRELMTELAGIAARPESEVARIEAAFVAFARRVERRLVRSGLERLVDALLPLELEKRAEESIARRGLAMAEHSDRPGGIAEIEFDEEGWELWHATINAAMATDPDNVTDTAAAAARRAADPAEVDALPARRTMLERRYDAFKTVLRDWLGSGLAGTRGKVVPHISVLLPVETLHETPGALPAVGGSGSPLSLSLVRKHLCDSAVTRFVLSLGHQVIEASHAVRTLKPHERRAKTVETGGRCEGAFCHSPPGRRLIPHHPEAYAVSGRTSFYDTVLLCEGGCHDDIHVGSKVIRLRNGRLLGPEGWVSELRAA
jgi:hypothetical protein